MQTFLPYPDLAASAEVLDDRRLGKQRVETLQVLRALTCDGYGWSNHPAVTMWRGHVRALVDYGLAIVEEWCRRGYADTTAEHIAEFAHPERPHVAGGVVRAGQLPPWWGHEPLHRSHRSALLRKDPAWYGPRLPPDTPDDLDYVWPDPPAVPEDPGPRTAWAVRGELGSGHLVVRPLGPEPAAGVHPRRGTKRARQSHRLTDELELGDIAVIPGARELEIVEIAGPDRIRAGQHRRRVVRLGRLPRTELRRPAVLQDPQVIFPLHDEPAIERLADDAHARTT